MTGFVIFVVVMIVISLINKAKQGSGGRNAKQSARMQKLVERIQAQQGGNQPETHEPGGIRPNQGDDFPQAGRALAKCLHHQRAPSHGSRIRNPFALYIRRARPAGFVLTVTYPMSEQGLAAAYRARCLRSA